jgi:hypothetical protein
VTRVVDFVRLQRSLLRAGGPRRIAQANTAMLRARASYRDAVRDGYYEVLSEGQLRARRSSSRAFVFGSGYSLHDLGPEEWRHIAAHCTIGFNAFVYQRWTRVDFHVVRAWSEGADTARLPALAAEFGALVAANPHYASTVFAFQDDYTALFAHTLLGRRTLPRGTRVFPYHTAAGDLPTRSFSEGLAHAMGTLCDATNFAVCLGFDEIVLTGVDLYDSRYFWIEPDKTYAIDAITGERVVSDRSDRGQRFDGALVPRVGSARDSAVGLQPEVAARPCHAGLRCGGRRPPCPLTRARSGPSLPPRRCCAASASCWSASRPSSSPTRMCGG